jgi:Tfp pilus assembly pilus retraction ATPase PilT
MSCLLNFNFFDAGYQIADQVKIIKKTRRTKVSFSHLLKVNNFIMQKTERNFLVSGTTGSGKS